MRAAIRRTPCQSRSSSQNLVFREHAREPGEDRVQQALLRGGLVRPGWPPRHSQQRPGIAVAQRKQPHGRPCRRVVRGADGPERGPVLRRVRGPQQRPVHRVHRERPGPAGRQGLPGPVPVLFPRRGQHGGFQFFQRHRAQRLAPVGAGPLRRRLPPLRPGHQGQVPGQCDDHVAEPRFRHQGPQHEHPDHERCGQQPLPLALHESPVQHRVPGDAADHARPRLAVQPLLQGAERRVPARAARRPDMPLPRHHRRRDRHDLQERHRLARPDPLRARHRQPGPVPGRHWSPVLQRRDQAPHRDRDHHAGRNVPLISGNTDKTAGGRVRKHRGSLRRRVT